MMRAPDFIKSETGLLPAIIQDSETKEVLMLAYMNAESWAMTLELGKVTFWSRSREELWTKGDTSGNVLHYVSHVVDCDQDTILIHVRPAGPACHTGTRTCFIER